MYIPLDYQLDFLKALHLIYYMFPPPVRVKYYGFSNRTQLDNEVFSKSQSFYTKPLDDTSIARFFSVSNLPFYLVQGGDQQKTQQSGEFGNIFTQPEITGMIPSIHNLDLINEEYIEFSSSGVTRLFEIVNLEISNINEQNPLRLYKLTLRLSKYKSFSEFTDRIDLQYTYAFETNKIYPSQQYKYIFKVLYPVLYQFILKVDRVDRKKYVDFILSKLYDLFKLHYNILLSKFTFKYCDFFKDYSHELYTYFFENPYSVTELEDINSTDLPQYQIMVDDINEYQFTSHPYIQDTLMTNIENNQVSLNDLQTYSTDMEYLISTYLISKHIATLT